MSRLPGVAVIRTEVDFHGKKRRNACHVSVSDPESRLYSKGHGKEARLYFMGMS
ncbi:MAG: hypothetical protein FWF31_11120 [Desulfobulbus sp.]|nr:hypothetical protein [Desulfobulbus sp.]